MRLQDTVLSELMPELLRDDRTTAAICTALQPIVSDVAEQIRHALVLPGVESLPEAVLDHLAKELHVEWYDHSASLEVKRALIKESDEIHATLGTPRAIERVVRLYVGDAVVEEWWEYGAEPYHFRLVTGNVEEGTRQAALVVKLVRQIKTVRSVFDGLFLDVTVGKALLSVGSIIQTAEVIWMEVDY